MSRVLEVLSAVKSGINGPQSGSDHRDRGAQASQQDGDQRIAQRRQEYPDLDNGNRDAGYWRPEAKKEQCARHSSDHIGEAGCQSSCFKEMRGSEIEQNRARQHALKQ